jgi:hypothetical protein
VKEAMVLIERVRQVNETHQHLDLAVEPWLVEIKPGQSVLARMTETWDPYLREQWYPVAVSKTLLTIERPLTTTYTPGHVVDLLGVIGQPYRFRKTLRNVLLLAYNTEPTPLIMMIGMLIKNRVSVTLVLLGDAAQYGTTHLPPEVEVLKGDHEMNWTNRVTTVGWADQVFAVVPQADEAGHFRRLYELFTQLRADIPHGHLWGVFRPPLPCGIGACSSCMVRIKGEQHPTCTQGPAFDLSLVMG